MLQTFQLLVVPVVGVFIGVIIAVLATPCVDALEHRRVPRALAAFIVILAAVAAVAGVGYVVAQQFASQWPALAEAAGDPRDALLSWMQEGPLGLTRDQVDQYVQQATEQVQQNVVASWRGWPRGPSRWWRASVPLVLAVVVAYFVASSIGAFFPVVGGLAAGAIAVGVAFVSNGSTDAAIVAAAATVVAQVEGNLLQPVVVGRAVGVHPLVVLLALTVGGILAGIPGAAMAVPFAAMASAAGNEWRRRREMRGDTDVASPEPG